MPVPTANVHISHMHGAVAALQRRPSRSEANDHHGDHPSSHESGGSPNTEDTEAALLSTMDSAPATTAEENASSARTEVASPADTNPAPTGAQSQTQNAKPSLWKTRVAAAVEKDRAESGRPRVSAPPQSNASTMWSQTISNLRTAQPEGNHLRKRHITFSPKDDVVDRYQKAIKRRAQTRAEIAFRIPDRAGALLSSDVAQVADGDLLGVSVEDPAAPRARRLSTASSPGKPGMAGSLFRLSKDGLPPSFIVQGADPKFEHPFFDNNERIHDLSCKVYITDYNAEQITENVHQGPEDVRAALSETRPAHSAVRWIHVTGIDWPTIRVVTEKLKVHPLAVQDIIMNKRIKSNNYEDHYYISALFAAVVRPEALQAPETVPTDTIAESSGSTAVPSDPKSAAAPLLSTAAAPPAAPSVTVTSKGSQGSIGKTPAAATSSHGSHGSHHAHAMFAAATQMAPGHFRQMPVPANIAGAAEWAQSKAKTWASGALDATGLSPVKAGPQGGGVALPSRVMEIQENAGPAEDLDEGSILDSVANQQGLVPVVEQVSVLLFPNGVLLTIFPTSSGNYIHPSISSSLQWKGLLRRSRPEASFLMNVIVHEVMDNTGSVIALYGSHVKELENRVFNAPKTRFCKEIHLLNRELSVVKRALRAHEHVIASLAEQQDKMENGEPWVVGLSATYFNDVLDDVTAAVEGMEELERTCESLINLIFNLVSFNQNSTMSVLTIVSLFFLPLTFVAGVYGMNFAGDGTSGGIPELTWSNGYTYFWILVVVLAVVVASLVIFFRKNLFNGL
ncbi:hypothetical protein M427DRAFT_33870 [Gonapodya prolifera JEL478]|uniref:Cora-domain-containing protein n=1 Tax=Gonapodya prolifera (strain JEL478) TaxID=1344416 RepID=A0A139A9F6_GONPJ|nr:hypothetical protein M427DRAFT_33870 [Gonapodya prolifera JEL478]|eukprot:KXS13461.1 hypothetical protein M427DRAFT_33870 [Gonapodya prolifera JEL478]